MSVNETNDPPDPFSIALAKALAATSRKAKCDPAESPLDDQVLRDLAKDVLSDSRGYPISSSSNFHYTLWQFGAEHVGKKSPGVSIDASIARFVETLEERAQCIADKKAGWVIEPTTNPSGERTNAATISMCSVFLDCDATGAWDDTLAALAALGLAYVAYQSGGYKPESPKWRIILPLATPFDVRDDSERASWKSFYHRVRVLVGAIGKLKGEGFDSRTEAPAAPFFAPERRDHKDPNRKVIVSYGASFDAIKFLLALPEVDVDAVDESKIIRAPRPKADPRELTDVDLDFIIKEIASVTNEIPRGRRDLYLALPGTLLDRGILPDDVITICTEISAAYPRRHPEKHKDNVRAAKTTVGKFLAGDSTYTRIGTMQATFPDVAAVIDRVVPDMVQQAITEAMASSSSIFDAEEVETNVQAVENAVEESAQVRKTKHERAVEALRKKLAKLAEETTALDDPKRAQGGRVLGHVLAGGFKSFSETIRAEAVKTVFGLVGYKLETVSFSDLIVVLGELSEELYRLGAKVHARAVERKKKNDAKKAAEEEAWQEEERARRERIRQMYICGEI